MRRLAHSTLAAQKHALVGEVFSDFTVGTRVATVDGYPGRITAVLDGPFPGTEGYEVILDGGIGGGQYSAGQLRPLASHTAAQSADDGMSTEAATLHLAAEDYPELSDILHDRPPNERVKVYASRRTALATDLPGQSSTPESGQMQKKDQAAEQLERAIPQVEQVEPPDACSFCGHDQFQNPTNTGRGTRMECAQCGGTMTSWGGQWQPDPPSSPENAASRQGDPRATINDLSAVHAGQRELWNSLMGRAPDDDGNAPLREPTKVRHRVEPIDDRTYSVRDVDRAHADGGLDTAMELEQHKREPEKARFRLQRVPIDSLRSTRHSQTGRPYKAKPWTAHELESDDSDGDWGERERLDGIRHGYSHNPDSVPPIVVCKHGPHHLMMDGAHRVAVAMENGETHIPAFVTDHEARTAEGAYAPEDFGQNAMARYDLLGSGDPEARAVAVDPRADPRAFIDHFAAREQLAYDPDLGFHMLATWADVRRKAKAIRDSGGVRILAATGAGVVGEVQGEHHLYESSFSYVPGTRKIAVWSCGCKWGGFAWGRSPAYKRFEGRMCSHLAALQYEAQSRGMFGRQVQEDRDRLPGQYQRSPVTVQYDRAGDANLNRRTVPPGNMRRTFSSSIHPDSEYAQQGHDETSAFDTAIGRVHDRHIVEGNRLWHEHRQDSDHYDNASSLLVAPENTLQNFHDANGGREPSPEEHVEYMRGAYGDGQHPLWGEVEDEVRRMKAAPQQHESSLDLAPMHAFVLASSHEPANHYLRFGDWSEDERSMNHAKGWKEDGVSVYDLHRGRPVDPDGEEGNDTADELRGRINDHIRGRHPAYIVTGDRVGTGHDGEPLLNNVRHVRDWNPNEIEKVETPGLQPQHYVSEWHVRKDPDGLGKLSSADALDLAPVHAFACEMVRAKDDPDAILTMLAKHGVAQETALQITAWAASVVGDEDGGSTQPGQDIPGLTTRDTTELKKKPHHQDHHTNDSRQHAPDFGRGVGWNAPGLMWCDQCSGSGCGHCGGTGEVMSGVTPTGGPGVGDLSATTSPVADDSPSSGENTFGGISATGGLQLHQALLQQFTADYAVDSLGGSGMDQTYRPPTQHSNSQNPGSTGWATSADPGGWVQPIIGNDYGITSAASAERGASDICGGCGEHIHATGYDDVPWVHSHSSNSYCDVQGTSDAAMLAGSPLHRPEAEPIMHEARFLTLDEARAAGQQYLANHPEEAKLADVWRARVDAHQASVEGQPNLPEYTHAGLALKAADTGRVLMIQRSIKDESDPARGTWEMPGGGKEPGDKSSLHTGVREWEEEVGHPFPEGGHVSHTWRSGTYHGHVVVIPSESQVQFAAGRSTVNPDDPGGDDHEQSAWWHPQDAKKNPALREELKKNNPFGDIAKAAGANGPTPELTFHHQATDPFDWGHVSMHEIEAHHEGRPVGTLSVHAGGYNDGMIDTIRVEPEYQRRGVADALWAHAKSLGIPIWHSDNQSPDAQAWQRGSRKSAGTAELTTVLAAVSTPCQTPEVIYDTKISDRTVGVTAEMPMDIDLDARQAETLDRNLHNMMEMTLAPMFPPPYAPPHKATLNDEPEPALPSTDGGVEDDPVPEAGVMSWTPGDPAPGQYLAAQPEIPWGYEGGPSPAPLSSEASFDDVPLTDLVAAFQATAAGQQLVAGAQGADTSAEAQSENAQIAAMARAVLAGEVEVGENGISKSAMKDFSFAEQQELISEGAADGTRARNFSNLEISGTHYALLGEDVPEEQLWF